MKRFPIDQFLYERDNMIFKDKLIKGYIVVFIEDNKMRSDNGNELKFNKWITPEYIVAHFKDQYTQLEVDQHEHVFTKLEDAMYIVDMFNGEHYGSYDHTEIRNVLCEHHGIQVALSRIHDNINILELIAVDRFKILK